MSDVAILSAAGLSFAWCAVHLFVGGRQIARPLRESTAVDPTVVATMWMCWHMVTVTLFTMALFFAMAVIWGAPFVVAGTILAAAIAGAGLMAAPVLGTTYKVLPQGWLFLPVVALGLYALLG